MQTLLRKWVGEMDDSALNGFDVIGQTSSDLDIDLDIGAIEDTIYDVREEEGFAYPAMLISNVEFADTLRVLKSTRKESYRLFDVWIDLNDGNPPAKQGSLPADSDTFLTMRYLGLNVTLYLDKEHIQTLDLKDPSVIEAFI